MLDTKYIKKLFLIPLAVFLLVLFIVWIRFYFTIGDTFRLKEKLEKISDVNSITDYKVYDGKAFVVLRLNNGGQLGLGAVNNADLVASDGLLLQQIDDVQIYCYHSDVSTLTGRRSGVSSFGISPIAIQRNYLKETELNSVSEVISSYSSLKNLFLRMPLDFRIGSENWICEEKRGLGED